MKNRKTVAEATPEQVFTDYCEDYINFHKKQTPTNLEEYDRYYKLAIRNMNDIKRRGLKEIARTRDICTSKTIGTIEIFEDKLPYPADGQIRMEAVSEGFPEEMSIKVYYKNKMFKLSQFELFTLAVKADLLGDDFKPISEVEHGEIK